MNNNKRQRDDVLQFEVSVKNNNSNDTCSALQETALCNIISDKKCEKKEDSFDKIVSEREVLILDNKTVYDKLPKPLAKKLIKKTSVIGSKEYKVDNTIEIPVQVNIKGLECNRAYVFPLSNLLKTKNKSITNLLAKNFKSICENPEEYNLEHLVVRSAEIKNCELQCLNNEESNTSENLFVKIGSSLQKTIIDHAKAIEEFTSTNSKSEDTLELYSDGDDDSVMNFNEDVDTTNNVFSINDIKENELFTDGVRIGETKNMKHLRHPVFYTNDNWINTFGGLKKEDLRNGVIYHDGYYYVPEKLCIANFYKKNAKALFSRPFIKFRVKLDDPRKFFRIKDCFFNILQDEMYKKMIEPIPYENLNKTTINIRAEGQDTPIDDDVLLCFKLCITYSAWKNKMPKVGCELKLYIGCFYDNLFVDLDNGETYSIDPSNWEKEISYLKEMDTRKLFNNLNISQSEDSFNDVCRSSKKRKNIAF